MQAQIDHSIAISSEVLGTAAERDGARAVADALPGQPAALPETASRWLEQRATLEPNAIALRFKQRGVWHARRWRELTDEVHEVAAGLAHAGLVSGDGLAIVGDGSPRLLIAALAALELGVHVVVLDGSADELADKQEARERRQRALLSAGARALFVARKADLDRVLDLGTLGLGERDALAWLRIVYDDDRGLVGRAGLTAYDELRTFGQLTLAQATSNARATAQSLAFVVTAANQLPPRSISHEALLLAAQTASDLPASAELVAFDALLGKAMRRTGLALWLAGRARLNLPETRASRVRDAREIGPSLSVAEASTYAELLAHYAARLPAAGSWRRRWIDRALRGAAQNALVRALDQFFIVRPLRRVLGVSRLRHALIVGDGVDTGARELFASLGIKLRAEVSSS